MSFPPSGRRAFKRRRVPNPDPAQVAYARLTLTRTATNQITVTSDTALVVTGIPRILARVSSLPPTFHVPTACDVLSATSFRMTYDTSITNPAQGKFPYLSPTIRTHLGGYAMPISANWVPES